jgi:predicted methyltransferase
MALRKIDFGRKLAADQRPSGDAGVTRSSSIEASATPKGKPMRSLKLLSLSLSLTVAPVAAQAVPPKPVAITTAVASPTRSPDNVKLDQSRKPVQVLQFLGLRLGMHVIDLFGGNQYWAQIMAPVVGAKGHVLVWEPAQFYDADSKKAFAEFEAKNPNVSIVSTPFEAISLPKNSADFVMLNLNYHDVYWTSEKYKIPTQDPKVFLKTVYAAMKPGAVIGVIDHIASPNKDTRATVDKLHRIDPAVVKADFKRAGFQLVGSSDVLRNRADDHSLLVFDPNIRGKTDRFVFKFRKPR